MTALRGPARAICYLATWLETGDRDGLLLEPEASRDPDASPRAPLIAALETEHAVLHFLAANPGPLGSGTLMEQLQALGYRGSEPTVGRLLRTLDRRGLTTRVSNRGRELTDKGRERLEELCESEVQLHYELELIRTIRTATIDDVLDVLIARRAIERESARLAAEHATTEVIAQLEAVIQEQREVLARSGIAVDSDVRFHSLVAQAGRNRVLTAAVDLIRRDKQLTIALDAILKHTNYAWVVGHERILQAIKRRAPEEAELAMLEHINSVIAEVRRYRDRLGPTSVEPGMTAPAPPRYAEGLGSEVSRVPQRGALRPPRWSARHVHAVCSREEGAPV